MITIKEKVYVWKKVSNKHEDCYINDHFRRRHTPKIFRIIEELTTNSGFGSAAYVTREASGSWYFWTAQRNTLDSFGWIKSHPLATKTEAKKAAEIALKLMHHTLPL